MAVERRPAGDVDQQADVDAVALRRTAAARARRAGRRTRRQRLDDAAELGEEQRRAAAGPTSSVTRPPPLAVGAGAGRRSPSRRRRPGRSSSGPSRPATKRGPKSRMSASHHTTRSPVERVQRLPQRLALAVAVAVARRSTSRGVDHRGARRRAATCGGARRSSGRRRRRSRRPAATVDQLGADGLDDRADRGAPRCGPAGTTEPWWPPFALDQLRRVEVAMVERCGCTGPHRHRHRAGRATWRHRARPGASPDRRIRSPSVSADPASRPAPETEEAPDR